MIANPTKGGRRVSEILSDYQGGWDVRPPNTDMENDPKLDRVEREIAACENGAYGESPAWLYLLGLSDWKDEKELLMEERNGEDYTENM